MTSRDNVYYLNQWHSYLDKKNNIVYIDIPFCASICSFCIFNPTYYKTPQQLELYINQAVLSDLKICTQIFKDYIPSEIFFGGGTPSLLSKEQILKICSHIPHFKEIKVKAFEAHPNSMSLEKLDLLLNLGFNYFTFGIQTFDEQILKLINRKSVDISKLKQIVQKIKSHNAIVSIDLIAYLKEWDNNEIKYTINDLKILTQFIKPNIIVIHSNYKKYKPTLKELKTINYAVLHTIMTSEYYTKNIDIFNEHTDLIEYGPYSYNIYSGSFDQIKMLKNYDCSGPGNLNNNQNVFAIGGIPTRKIYSYIGGHKQWYQYYDNGVKYIEETPYNTFIEP